MLLHTINKSPFASDTLSSCLACALPGSHVLLIEDGVYAARAGTTAAALLRDARGVSCYALADDVAARGLQDTLDPGVKLLDYAGFVQLCTECHAVQSWY